MSSDRSVFLITGASRGIGFALVETLLARPNTTVIATVRDLNSPNVVKLQELLKAEGSDLKVIKLDSAVPEDAATRHLLLASKMPKFIIISSVAGSLQYAVNSPMSNLSYSLSKAAVNVVGIRLAYENNEIITLLLSPGLASADMVLGLAKELPAFGERLNSNSPITSKESAEKLLNLIDNAQKADSGRFIDAIDGKTLPW